MPKNIWFRLSRHEGADGGTETPPEGGAPVKTFKPIDSQEALEAVLADRLKRQRAQFGDYDSLKEKAAKFDAGEADKLSAVEKEKARADAAEKAQSDLARKTSERIAAAELKAALTGLIDPADMAEEIDGLNLAKFIGEDGEVDSEAVAKLQARYAARTKAGKKPAGDLDQGGRGDGKPIDFRTASKEEVAAENARQGMSRW